MSDNERRLDPLVRIVRQRQDDPISIRDLAKRLCVKQCDVLTACEDNDLCVNVGIGIQGAGYAEHDNIGDYTIEDLSFDANMALCVKTDSKEDIKAHLDEVRLNTRGPK